MATDPVCGMQVDERNAAGSSVFEGSSYYFCSTGCTKKFEANPSAYVGAPPPAGDTEQHLGHAHHQAQTAQESPGNVHDMPDVAGAVPPSTIYTCPMHPKIVRNAPGDCPICGMALVPMRGVTVAMTPQNVAPDAAAWEFKVVLDTHSQDLSDDLTKSTVLVDAAGKQQAPVTWKGAPPGGHHREGVLSFAPIKPAPASVELRMQRSGESEPRSFRWELQ